MERYWSDFRKLGESIIDGRHIWIWECQTSIGEIQIVQYEEKEEYITTFTFYNNSDKAYRKYDAIRRGIVNGKM